MIEFIRERWDIIFLSLAILVQWGVIINILGRMENLRRCMRILNEQNKKTKYAIDDLYTLTKLLARIEEEEEEEDKE